MSSKSAPCDLIKNPVAAHLHLMQTGSHYLGAHYNDFSNEDILHILRPDGDGLMYQIRKTTGLTTDNNAPLALFPHLKLHSGECGSGMGDMHYLQPGN